MKNSGNFERKIKNFWEYIFIKTIRKLESFSKSLEIKKKLCNKYGQKRIKI